MYKFLWHVLKIGGKDQQNPQICQVSKVRFISETGLKNGVIVHCTSDHAVHVSHGVFHMEYKK